MKCLRHKNEIRPFKDKYAPRNFRGAFQVHEVNISRPKVISIDKLVWRISLHNARRYALTCNFFHNERLEYIALFDIVEFIKSDTAFVALRYLARIILESLKR